MKKEMFVNQFKKFEYVVQYPANFCKKEKYPCIILLGGAGTRGTEIDILKTHPFFKETENFAWDFVVYSPQCYADTWFDIFEQLKEFVEFCIEQTFIDKERVYLMGASMGGYATWQLGMSKPELFAAIVPICGGGMYWNAVKLKNVPIWAFHGKEDNIVFWEESKKMVDAVNRLGGNAKLTIYEDVEHNSWDYVFSSREVFDWLLLQKRMVVKCIGKEENENE